MREIVLDTETTGLDPSQGDRIVEIGAVELYDHVPTGATYHQYINPQRIMPQEAFAVHGLGDDFLRDKPLFADIVSDFIAFIDDSTLVIHNASFDMKFLNAEFQWCDRPQIPAQKALDTLAIARKQFPGSPASLDALCRRFNISTTTRTLHGALLDSEILAEVYLELVGGRQPDLTLVGSETSQAKQVSKTPEWIPSARPAPLPSRVSKDELKNHEEFISQLSNTSLWSKINR
ncbi:MAG: DNA polymerase III subunit epsilon [Paracoccaceae bacterium]|nr:DNA polymerase III subunit epsilon [Paracoccaceae bacterium]